MNKRHEPEPSVNLGNSILDFLFPTEEHRGTQILRFENFNTNQVLARQKNYLLFVIVRNVVNNETVTKSDFLLSSPFTYMCRR